MTEQQEEVTQETQFKPRRPVWAAIMSFFVTGLGQVYNGQWKKGIGFMAVEFLLGLSMFVMWDDFVSFLLCMSILIGFNLFVAGEAFASALKRTEYIPGPSNRWQIYGIFLLTGLAIGSGFDMVLADNYYKTYKAPSESMLPTIEVGDHFMAEVLGDAPIERGDVVIFKLPEDENVDFVKRVVGLPGDTIEVRDQVVYVNGQILEESYVQHVETTMIPTRDNFGPTTIPSGEYFVMGDNREKSHDSRFFGPVKREKIMCRAKYIYFPGDINKRGWSKRLGKEF